MQLRLPACSLVHHLDGAFSQNGSSECKLLLLTAAPCNPGAICSKIIIGLVISDNNDWEVKSRLYSKDIDDATANRPKVVRVDTPSTESVKTIS